MAKSCLSPQKGAGIYSVRALSVLKFGEWQEATSSTSAPGKLQQSHQSKAFRDHKPGPDDHESQLRNRKWLLSLFQIMSFTTGSFGVVLICQPPLTPAERAAEAGAEPLVPCWQLGDARQVWCPLAQGYPCWWGGLCGTPRCQ